jgi:microcystin-dependent protein
MMSMATPFLGEIRAFSFSFPPSGWALCNGQTLPINQNQALFALLGTTYGGNGVQNFMLPNLQGRIAMSASNAFPQGQTAGEEAVVLTMAQLPVHTHVVTAAANGASNATNVPGPTVILGSGTTSEPNNPPVLIYSSAASNVALAPLGANGSGQGHENRMPSLVLSYCIALQGIFPSRG